MLSAAVCREREREIVLFVKTHNKRSVFCVDLESHARKISRKTLSVTPLWCAHVLMLRHSSRFLHEYETEFIRVGSDTEIESTSPLPPIRRMMILNAKDQGGRVWAYLEHEKGGCM